MKTNFLGLDLKNPVIIAAGPWNRDGQSIKKCLESGAAAAVTETIVTDAISDVCPKIYAFTATYRLKAGKKNLKLPKAAEEKL